ncbi:MAG TPA: hypothetical protein VGF71_11545 [Caulobacteraceae bacterium]|jgi:hypothetical protein
MTAPQIFWLVLGGVSILMFGVSRLTLHSLKAGRRPAPRIVLAHLIAVALVTIIGNFKLPYLTGWTRWGYALALCAFGTAPWLIMDFGRMWLRRGIKSPPP